MSYPNILFVANLDSLSDRRDKLSRTFFKNMCKPTSCLHHLLPLPCNTLPISRLRSSIDDYIDRAHARSTTIENGYLPCARAWSSQCGIAIVRAQI